MLYCRFITVMEIVMCAQPQNKKQIVQYVVLSMHLKIIHSYNNNNL